MRWLVLIVAAGVLWLIGFQMAASAPMEWGVAITMGVLVAGLAAVNWVLERTIGRPPRLGDRDGTPSDGPLGPSP